MAIQPIDLQTLFTQVDKVGKAQSAQREGLAVQQAIQGAHLQEKTEARIQEVNQAQDTGEGAEKINERRPRGKEGKGGENEKRRSGGEDEDEPKEDLVFHDPRLGRNIDISL